MGKRAVLVGVIAAAVAVGVPLAASGAPRATSGVLVVTKGTEIFDVNGAAVATFRFAPEVLSVPSGTRVTWKHGDSGSDPHSITIVTNPRQLPHNFEAANCKPCQAANNGHFPRKGPPVAVLNKGAPGLDTVGDSLLIRPKRGATVSAIISAPPGTTLHYVCIIHPWMQATIHVT